MNKIFAYPKVIKYISTIRFRNGTSLEVYAWITNFLQVVDSKRLRKLCDDENDLRCPCFSIYISLTSFLPTPLWVLGANLRWTYRANSANCLGSLKSRPGIPPGGSFLPVMYSVKSASVSETLDTLSSSNLDLSSEPEMRNWIVSNNTELEKTIGES